MSRDAARREVRRAVDAQWTRAAFADRAGLDPGTLSDFLDGKRWAQGYNRGKIEKALGWPAGRIGDLADGVPVLGGEVVTIYEDGSRDTTQTVIVERPVGLGLDDEATDLRPEQVEAIRALIRSMKAPPETP